MKELVYCKVAVKLLDDGISVIQETTIGAGRIDIHRNASPTGWEVMLLNTMGLFYWELCGIQTVVEGDGIDATYFFFKTNGTDGVRRIVDPDTNVVYYSNRQGDWNDQ